MYFYDYVNLILCKIFFFCFYRKEIKIFAPEPLHFSHFITDEKVKRERKELPYQDGVNWPNERPKVDRNSSSSEFSNSKSLPNAKDDPPWPLPPLPEEVDNRYLLYECSEHLCGGLGNRLLSINLLYFWGIISNRAIAVKITRPCNVKNHLLPRIIPWNLTYSKPSHHFTLSGTYGFQVALEKLREIHTVVMNPNNKVVSIEAPQPAYAMLFAKFKFFRNKLLQKGFTAEQLDNLSYVTVPLKYQLYDLLFRLNSNIQKMKDNFLSRLNNKPLICAQLRTGGGSTIPGDVARGVRSETQTVWDFIDKQLKTEKFKDSKIFLATDNNSVREEFLKKYKRNGLEISGPIIHVDRWKDQVNIFDGTEKTACSGTEKVFLDFEIIGECDLLIVTDGSSFGSLSAARNRHRDKIYCWRCESSNCIIEDYANCQTKFIKHSYNRFKELKYLHCNDIYNCKP